MRALALTCLVVVFALVSARPAALPTNVLRYLERYGYLSPTDVKFGRVRSKWKLYQAVRNLQRFTGLNETGNPEDPSTVDLVTKQRCGFRDLGKTAQFRRKKRYSLHGTFWHKNRLTYKMATYTSDLTRQQVDNTIQSALSMWAKVSPLTFSKVTDGPADIEIIFENKKDRGYSFDGRGGELAYAYFPGSNAGRFGDLHFDDEELFTVHKSQPGGVDLKWLALHELGHSLGLEHSSTKGAIMYPIYSGYHPGLELHRDDVLGIQQLYGKPSINRVPPTPHQDPTQSPGKPNPCTSTLDAMIMTADQTTYAFKGAYFWPVGDQGAFTGALKISQFWDGLENDIDAGYTRHYDRLTFIFKGSRYWTYSNRTLVQGPRNVTELNLPAEVHNMDAAVEWGANGELYIFKGSMFWRYNNYKKSIDPGYPKTIQSVLPKLPSHIEAALQWKNGKTYFFKGAEYYTLDDASVRIRKGYPKSISTYWMGCSPVGLIGGKISPYRSSLSSIATRSVFPHAVEFVLFAVFIITSVVQFH